MIVGHRASHVSFSFTIQHRSEVGARRKIDVGFHVTEARQWTVRDSGSGIAHFRLQAIVRDDAIDQANSMSFGRVDDVAEKEQFFRFRSACVMSQQPGRAEVAAVADFRISCAKPRLI